MRDWWWRIKASRKNYPPKQTAAWIIQRSFLGTMLILGGFYKQVWAGNIFSFICVVTCILQLLLVILPNHQIKQDKKSVPDAISGAFNIVIILLLSGFGWFVLASVQLASTLFSLIHWKRVENLNKLDDGIIEAEFIDVPDERKELKR